VQHGQEIPWPRKHPGGSRAKRPRSSIWRLRVLRVRRLLPPQNSRWVRRRKFTLAELVDEPWVLTPSMHSTLLAEAFQASGLAIPTVNVRVYSTHQSINLIATSRFISALSGSVLRFGTQRSLLKVLPIDFPIQPWSVGVVTLKDRMVSP
jgi:DNA-binding transcriptional LysR family regulator